MPSMHRSVVALLAIVVTLPAPVHGQDSTRARATARIAEWSAVRNPEGIDTLEALDINGTKQWISIKGRDRRNPVLLFIHGGPASPVMPSSWAFQGPWEDYFTVVQWDQRGAGKSAFAPDEFDRQAASVTLAQIVDDGIAIVDHLRTQLGQRKVIVLGWSWGSSVGSRMALKAPEKIHAYVGVGQVVTMAAESIGYARVKALAREAGNAQALKELESAAPYPGTAEHMLQHVGMVRRWMGEFGGGWHNRNSADLYERLAEWGPEYTPEDWKKRSASEAISGLRLLGALTTTDLRKDGPAYKVPVFFFMGAHDLYTPIEAVQEYNRLVRAPLKALVTFEKSGHFVMYEEPGRFLVELVQRVRPIAVGNTTSTRTP